MDVKVLIIRFSSIGDIVLTTPVIRCVKQQMEGNVELHFLTKARFASLLEANPYIDRLHTIERHTKEVLPELKRLEFDYIFDLHNNLRSYQVKKALRGMAFSFQKLNLKKWFYVNTKVNVMPDVHIVDRYMETTKAFGIKNDGAGLDYFIPPEDQNAPDQLPTPFSDGYVGFVIGGSYPGKVLPVEKIIAICNALQEPVVLLGGPEDQTKGAAIAEDSTTPVFNACGAFSLNESAALVKQARCIITHDTGLMHIAAAFRKKIISIWGATVPAFGMSPYQPGEGSVIIEPRGVWDRPYSKLGNNKFYKPPFRGMQKIDIEEVVRAVKA